MWWPDVQFILYAWNRLKWRKLLLFNYDSWNHYIKIKHSRRKAYMLCGQSCYIWAVEVVNGLLWRKMIRDLYQGTARALDWGVPWSFEIHSSFLWTAHVDDTPSPFLVHRQNDVHVAFMMFGVPLRGKHALRPGRGLSSPVWKYCIHSHQRRSADNWCWSLPATDHTVFTVQLSLDGCDRKEHLHPCQQFWLKCRGHPDVAPTVDREMVHQELL